MREEFRDLIRQGLHQDNLIKLTKLCTGLFNEGPSLYGTLRFIFDRLIIEYDSQGISVDRDQLITESIEQPILLLLEMEQEPPEVFLGQLDKVYKAFENLRLQLTRQK